MSTKRLNSVDLQKIDKNVIFITGPKGFLVASSQNKAIDGVQISRKVRFTSTIDKSIYKKTNAEKQQLKRLKLECKNGI